ncbi:MAG: hypothetical protein KDA85_02890 [Planctomycetaceae bacterium]|nr:hypothetical protein [Planctomycetaceae bacterium]
MQRPTNAPKIVLARNIDGDTEIVEWIRQADTVWIVSENEELVIGPDAWKQAWADLQDRGFVEVFPNDQQTLTVDQDRVLDLVRDAFHGVKLGNGVGLRQGQGLDDYADERTLASYREQDEKNDWAKIPLDDLEQCNSSLSFFDPEGMRFHLPAYLVADLQDHLQTVDVLFHLTFASQGAESRFDRFSLLSSAQREAVRQFLLLRLSDHHREFSHPMIEAALINYWNASSAT